MCHLKSEAGHLQGVLGMAAKDKHLNIMIEL
jgi:hypothetical protein